MSDDTTPCDVEPNGGPCISEEEIQRRNDALLQEMKPVERAVVILDHYRKPGSSEHILAKLRKQLAALEAIERELERKKQVINEIADIREKIKLKGEIPCA
jgi:DNA repair exonuclease SbcCD ATPase subunit